MIDDRGRLIDRYLNELCWAMGGSLAEQQTARDELRAHIVDAVREAELAGAASDDALRQALEGLGPAAAVGRAWRASRTTSALRRELVQPEGALILARRRERHLPAPILMLALAGSLAAAVAAVLAYAWP